MKGLEDTWFSACNKDASELLNRLRMHAFGPEPSQFQGHCTVWWVFSLSTVLLDGFSNDWGLSVQLAQTDFPNWLSNVCLASALQRNSCDLAQKLKGTCSKQVMSFPVGASLHSFSWWKQICTNRKRHYLIAAGAHMSLTKIDESEQSGVCNVRDSNRMCCLFAAWIHVP